MYYYSKLVKSIIGDYVYEALTKSILKLDTKSVVDIDELASSLKIAPKSVVAFLMENLSDMEKDGAKEIKLPWDKNASMLVNKMGQDVYKGHISKNGKIAHEFDLCSIPQLSAHLLSHFELYNETPEQKEETKEQAPPEINEPTIEAPIEEGSAMESSFSSEHIKQHLHALEAKINALIMLSVKEPIKKNQAGLNKAVKALKKGGLAPTMPKPPRPGIHAGSQQGIAQTGIHSDKTAASDMGLREKYDVQNPNLKSGNVLSQQHGLPQQPKSPKQLKQTKSPATQGQLKQSEQAKEKQNKMSFAIKSDKENSKCLDCGQPDMKNGHFQRCACFKIMSEPTMKKSDNNVVTLFFKNDWKEDDKIALWLSLKKNRRE
jgi:hypothetical protein